MSKIKIAKEWYRGNHGLGPLASLFLTPVPELRRGPLLFFQTRFDSGFHGANAAPRDDVRTIPLECDVWRPASEELCIGSVLGWMEHHFLL